MKLHISKDWLRRKIDDLKEAGIEEPGYIGPVVHGIDFDEEQRLYREDQMEERLEAIKAQADRAKKRNNAN